MGLWSKYVTDPVSDLGRDIVGDDIADVFSDYGGFLEEEVDEIIGFATFQTQKELLEDLDPANLLDPFKEAADTAEELAAEAATLEQLSTAESVRVMEEENERSVATARARGAASGLSGASTEIYISALEETGKEDVEWLKKVGASNYESRIKEGQLASAQAEGAMWGFGASVIGLGTGVMGLFS